MYTDKYGAVDAAYTKRMIYYIVEYVSNAFTLHEDTTTDGQISDLGKLLIRAEYISCMKTKAN